MIKFGGAKAAPPHLESYPGYGFETGRGDWLVNVMGIAYQTPPFKLSQKMMLKMLGGVMKASESELQSETFQARVWPFFVEGDRGQKIQIELDDQVYLLRRKSRRNGRIDNWLRLEDSTVRQAMVESADGRRTLKLLMSTTHPHSPVVECSIDLISRSGLSVISDIDDTIKESDVTNRRELLMNTFVREFRSIQGMAELYRQWRHGGASFHYVSSSPWQLFGSLNAMRSDSGFPGGTMHLRNFRLRDQFLKKLMFRRKGKATEITKLVKNLPDRKFILIGDSGEKDPEIYQKIGRKYPGQIAGIFIRNLGGRPMDSERVSRLQRAAGQSQSGVFSDADELARQAMPLIERYGRQLVAR